MNRQHPAARPGHDSRTPLPPRPCSALHLSRPSRPGAFRLAVLLLAGGAVPALAGTYYVATTGDDATGDGSMGSPWRTIQKSVNSAGPGDTVCLRGGTYHEVLTVNKAGTSGARFVLCGYASEEAVIDGRNILPGGSSIYAPLVSVSGSFVELRNLSVHNSTGINVLAGSASGPLSDSLLKNIRSHTANDRCIQVSMATRVTVEDCEVWDFCRSVFLPKAPPAGGGLSLVNATDCIARRNYVHEGYGEGINDLRSNGSIIEGNTVYATRSVGIYVDNSQNSTVRGNFLRASKTDRTYWKGAGNPSTSIAIGAEKGNAPVTTNVWVCNNFTLDTSRGVVLDSFSTPLTNIHIHNNTFVNTHTGPVAETTHCLTIYAAANRLNGVSIRNNIFRKDAGTPAGGAGTNLTLSHNNWSVTPAGSFSGKGDVIGDAQLQLGPGTPNPNWFKFPSTSPCRNQAVVIAEVTADFFGTPRGAEPDIGGYEFTAGGAQPAP